MAMIKTLSPLLWRQFQEIVMDDNQSLEELLASIKSQWVKLRDICQVQHVIHPYGVKWAMKIVRDGIPELRFKICLFSYFLE